MSNSASTPLRPQGTTRHALEFVGLALVAAYAVLLASWAAEGYWLIDSAGRAIANDFVNVWAAGKLALEGHAAAAYDWTIHREVEVAAVAHEFVGYYGWPYPPTYLFVAAALATMPYITAAPIWLAVSLPAYMATVRAIIGDRLGLILACAFPGILWNITAGQNGFLTAALIGAFLVQIERRPIVAGIFLGLLTYKPHFGLVFPIFLAIDGRWRVIAAAAATTVALGAVSTLAFGVESWRAFFEWMPITGTAVFADGRAGLNKLQSLFGVVRWLGGSMTMAWIAQGLLIAGATLALVLLWRRNIHHEIKSAALAIGAMLATPYLYIYDFPVLAIPLAFLLRLALREGFLAYELFAIAAVCGLILAFPLVVMPVGFVAVVIVAAMIARRASAEQFVPAATSLRKTAAAA
jgi:glycosyl transferase family 87